MRVHAIRNKARDMRVLGAAALGLAAVSASRWDASAQVAGAFLAGGLTLASAAVLLRAWAILYIAGHKTERLITEGPFSLCRNPIYLSTLLGALGVALATETLTFPLLALLWLLPYLLVQIGEEERKLELRHGERYRAYAAATPRLLPALRGYAEPPVYPVRPREFRRWYTDALWFV